METPEQVREAALSIKAYVSDTPPAEPFDVVVAADIVAAAYLDPWRPIASAPRDGTRVLLGAEKWVAEGFYIVPLGRWIGVDASNRTPTHWTPLPRPPAPAA